MLYCRNRLIHMHHCRGITRKKLNLFLQVDPTLQSIYALSPTELQNKFLFTKKQAENFYQDLHHPMLLQQMKQDLATYTVITIKDENYPKLLKYINDPPLVLYAKGKLEFLSHQPAISIVGTRMPSNEGKHKTEKIVQPLIERDFMIVSGMAKGIDRFAHEAALKYNGKTIAVLGAGFQHIYPKQNRQLFEEIVKKGLLLSEYPPHIPPAKYQFPERNRIISGLSYGTLVVEAMERSGTLITVGQALDQGREVFAMPGSILDPKTKGCHQLIQDGAKLVYEAKDILEDWDRIGKFLYSSIEYKK